MYFERSSSDRRCRQNKRVRFPNTCTVCAEELPTKKRRWGLVWHDGKSGMCKPCLARIRKNIGYYARFNA